MKIWEPKPPGTFWATPGLLRNSSTYQLYSFNYLYCLPQAIQPNSEMMYRNVSWQHLSKYLANNNYLPTSEELSNN